MLSNKQQLSPLIMNSRMGIRWVMSYQHETKENPSRIDPCTSCWSELLANHGEINRESTHEGIVYGN